MEKSGQLPTKRTTAHIPKPRQPEGAVNLKGKLKIIDKTTGLVRWIDGKKPLILDNNDGDPVHSK